MCNCGASDKDHDCCCGEGYRGDSFQCSDECCCAGGHFQRRFKTKAEQIAELESYLEELKKEVQAVEEMVADLRK
jgi:hypothetical protein